jgi:uncharacterized protein (DUF2252 family)
MTTAISDRRRTPASERLSRADRIAIGKDARALTPLTSHGDFAPATNRDPIGALLGQASTRVAELVPVRHGRMLASPFAYFRGAALPMAADLAVTPVSGLRVQLCGDAHVANFGAFASPERSLVFDINDFDETLPGPFEWDVKRLAASLAVAAQGFSPKACRRIVLAAAEGYRSAMLEFAGQSQLQVWYAQMDVDHAMPRFRAQVPAKRFRAIESALAGARGNDGQQALSKITAEVDGQRRIISQPPTIVPIEELFNDVATDAVYTVIQTVLEKYRRTLQSDRRRLVEQYRLVQVARKVVGVGSVGQHAWIILLDSGDGDEPLVLQAKEAEPSILADYCGHSRYRNQGERVVAGQHLMQAQSDIFLGWTHNVSPDGTNRDLYVRQLRDWKFAPPIDRMRPSGLAIYASMCGWTLARAHARSGDRVAIAAYLGRSDKFDRAIAAFAEVYADQNEQDSTTFQSAVKSGRIEAVTGV